MLAFRLAAVGVAGALMFAGCGEAGDAGSDAPVTVSPGKTPSSSETATGSATTKSTAEIKAADLKIVVLLTEGKSKEYTLTCKPTGGTLPNAESGCAVLAQSAPQIFAKRDKDVMCTQQVGGPEKARVTGTFDGQKIDSEFSQTDGCEISRWTFIKSLTGHGGGSETS